MLTMRKRAASSSAMGSNTCAFAVIPCRHSAAGLEVVLETILTSQTTQDAVMHLAPRPQRHRRSAAAARHVAAVLDVALEQAEGMLGVLDVGAHVFVEILDRLVGEPVVLGERERGGAVRFGQLLLVAPPRGEAFGGALAAIVRHGARKADHLGKGLARDFIELLVGGAKELGELHPQAGMIAFAGE